MQRIYCREDDTYNQAFLNEKDSEFLRGFDWAVEMAADNFFDNDMDGLADEKSYIGHILCEKLPKSLREKYTMEYTFGDREEEERTVKTYADLIRYRLLNWIEMTRDELITSMLDNMDEAEYTAIKKKVLKEIAESENPK